MDAKQMIDQAVKQLSRSGRGLHAMRVILDWLDDGGLSLDQYNQDALLTILALAWRKPEMTRDTMRDALESHGVVSNR